LQLDDPKPQSKCAKKIVLFINSDSENSADEIEIVINRKSKSKRFLKNKKSAKSDANDEYSELSEAESQQRSSKKKTQKSNAKDAPKQKSEVELIK
jgi:ABC-type transporter lipoprotein component MlaA